MAICDASLPQSEASADRRRSRCSAAKLETGASDLTLSPRDVLIRFRRDDVLRVEGAGRGRVEDAVLL
jgi:hypothetical protein